jgi:hypothetical protein
MVNWYDYVTIKYDAAGDELWVAEYDGPGHGQDYPGGIAIDNTGNVCVTGRSDRYDYSSYDCTTIKYDPDGNELWVARYSSQRQGGDNGSDLALDDAGNVYVAGYGLNPVGGLDCIAIKYAPEGTETWVARYTRHERYDEGSKVLGLDASGNVYVAGWTYAPPSSDYLTIKYVPTVTIALDCLTPTVQRGENLRFRVVLTNESPDAQTVKCWAKIRLPDGSWYSRYAVVPTQVILNPSQSVTRSLEHIVPQTAPYGIYEYWGYVGPDTLTVWGSEMFNFTVTR